MRHRENAASVIPVTYSGVNRPAIKRVLVSMTNKSSRSIPRT
jgi:hypothetical protein